MQFTIASLTKKKSMYSKTQNKKEKQEGKHFIYSGAGANRSKDKKKR